MAKKNTKNKGKPQFPEARKGRKKTNTIERRCLRCDKKFMAAKGFFLCPQHRDTSQDDYVSYSVLR